MVESGGWIGEEGFVAKTLGITFLEKSSIFGWRGWSLEEVVRGRSLRGWVWIGEGWRRGFRMGRVGESGGRMFEGIASLFEWRGSKVEAISEESVECGL